MQISARQIQLSPTLFPKNKQRKSIVKTLFSGMEHVNKFKHRSCWWDFVQPLCILKTFHKKMTLQEATLNHPNAYSRAVHLGLDHAFLMMLSTINSPFPLMRHSLGVSASFLLNYEGCFAPSFKWLKLNVCLMGCMFLDSPPPAGVITALSSLLALLIRILVFCCFW